MTVDCLAYYSGKLEIIKLISWIWEIFPLHAFATKSNIVKDLTATESKWTKINAQRDWQDNMCFSSCPLADGQDRKLPGMEGDSKIPAAASFAMCLCPYLLLWGDEKRSLFLSA